MGLRSAEQGTRREVTFRPGVDEFPFFHGVNKQAGPTIPPNQFEHLENVRFTGGILVSRGGQASASDTTLTGCVRGIFDGGPD